MDRVNTEPRYERRHSGDWTCLDCGCLVAEKEAHTRFHSILSSHAWALAVLKTAHLASHIHDKYEVAERIDSKKFDNWSADALAEVMAEMDAAVPCQNCGKTMADHDALAHCWGPESKTYTPELIDAPSPAPIRPGKPTTGVIREPGRRDCGELIDGSPDA